MDRARNSEFSSGASIAWWRYGLAAALAAAGCAAPAVVDEQSRFYPPPIGTVIELHRDLTVAPDHARVTIQRGAVAPGVHPFDTWCQLEVNDVFPTEQTVRADTFTVYKVSRETAQVVMGSPPQMVAGVDTNDSGSSDVTQIWHLWLKSPQQLNVRRLSCGGWFDTPSRAQYPSVVEIRAALGEVASLHLPTPPSDRSTSERAP